ncbi:hypothetical protein SGHV113 [Glossina pallidipes salivary gland hypertrophy virus]|uniref:Uncharacterized protein n=1 Tax=Glossina hytrovirus (isolate Glossina pallidipes/Ethiopia/Seibersdorf/-) TaxID=379529 RepID=B0YLR7_GHVS|nr:hypothetical protein SGHV113 [Glossina pallidipes salivary gland hypertrophy virus]ABQ08886.1 hypothetical protein SGHV113 [Glossina pallidipes salivary gland hypertrophy virus]
MQSQRDDKKSKKDEENNITRPLEFSKLKTNILYRGSKSTSVFPSLDYSRINLELKNIVDNFINNFFKDEYSIYLYEKVYKPLSVQTEKYNEIITRIHDASKRNNLLIYFNDSTKVPLAIDERNEFFLIQKLSDYIKRTIKNIQSNVALINIIANELNRINLFNIPRNILKVVNRTPEPASQLHLGPLPSDNIIEIVDDYYDNGTLIVQHMNKHRSDYLNITYDTISVFLSYLSITDFSSSQVSLTVEQNDNQVLLNKINFNLCNNTDFIREFYKKLNIRWQ